MYGSVWDENPVLAWVWAIFGTGMVVAMGVATVISVFNSIDDGESGCRNTPHVQVKYDKEEGMKIRDTDGSAHADELPICSDADIVVHMDDFSHVENFVYGVSDIEMKNSSGRGGQTYECAYLDKNGSFQQNPCYEKSKLSQSSNVVKKIQADIDSRELLTQLEWSDKPPKHYTIDTGRFIVIPAVDEKLDVK